MVTNQHAERTYRNQGGYQSVLQQSSEPKLSITSASISGVGMKKTNNEAYTDNKTNR